MRSSHIEITLCGELYFIEGRAVLFRKNNGKTYEPTGKTEDMSYYLSPILLEERLKEILNKYPELRALIAKNESAICAFHLPSEITWIEIKK